MYNITFPAHRLLVLGGCEPSALPVLIARDWGVSVPFQFYKLVAQLLMYKCLKFRVSTISSLRENSNWVGFEEL